MNVARLIHGNPIGRARPIAAWMRFIRWQIGSRILGQPIVHSWVDETRLVLSTGGVRGNYYVGLMELADMAFALHFLRSQDLFADVGANVGVYTVLASGVRGCRTIAFEPLPETMGHLLDNVFLNQIQDRVTVHQIGLASKSGQLKFTSDLDATNHVVSGSDVANAVQVNVERMDETIGEDAPILMKVDVEGFESEVLAGAGSTLKNLDLKAIIIELNGSGKRYQKSDDDIHSELREFGFLPYEYDAFTRSLTPRRHCRQQNAIYVRDIEFVRQRVADAPRVTVAGIQL